MTFLYFLMVFAKPGLGPLRSRMGTLNISFLPRSGVQADGFRNGMERNSNAEGRAGSIVVTSWGNLMMACFQTGLWMNI